MGETYDAIFWMVWWASFITVGTLLLHRLFWDYIRSDYLIWRSGYVNVRKMVRGRTYWISNESYVGPIKFVKRRKMYNGYRYDLQLPNGNSAGITHFVYYDDPRSAMNYRISEIE